MKNLEKLMNFRWIQLKQFKTKNMYADSTSVLTTDQS